MSGKIATLAHMVTASFPPAPTFTEENVGSQAGKGEPQYNGTVTEWIGGTIRAHFKTSYLRDQIFIVTGASNGVGKELTKILYSKDAKVYMAARSEEKVNAAMKEIKAAVPKSSGTLVYLHLDLDDLTTIKKSALEFLAHEERLDVLWNNAGVMMPPEGSRTKQGYELQLGTNCLAPFLFTKLLTPILQKTAKVAPGAVRVVWVSSSMAEISSPKTGIDFSNLDNHQPTGASTKYGVSKVGNWYHGTEFAKLYKKDGIISVSLNPGNLRTGLQKHVPGWQMAIMNLTLHKAIYGAYTELFAGLSPDVMMEKSGSWIQPWGRFVGIRADLAEGTKTVAEGGSGTAEKFWKWSEDQVKPYL